MKFSVAILILLACIIKGEVTHEVILRGGNVMTGYVSKMTHDSLKIVSASSGQQKFVALDTVLYIHNSNGKLFYLAPEIRKFFHSFLAPLRPFGPVGLNLAENS